MAEKEMEEEKGAFNGPRYWVRKTRVPHLGRGWASLPTEDPRHAGNAGHPRQPNTPRPQLLYAVSISQRPVGIYALAHPSLTTRAPGLGAQSCPHTSLP